MKHLISILATSLLLTPVFAASTPEPGYIIQVSRPLQMRAADPIPPRDYFVNLGRAEGAREGVVLEVVRSISVVDGRLGATGFPMHIVLGEIQLLGTDDHVSWGRLSKMRAAKELPNLEVASFMIGDEVRVKTRLPERRVRP